MEDEEAEEEIDAEEGASDEEDELRDILKSKEEELEEAREEAESLRDELKERDERIEELESRVKQVRADFENYKKRADDKRERAERRAREEIVEDFLGVRDDLERALEAGGDAEDVREGVEMTLETLDEALDKYDIERVDVDEFDPQKHEAMARVESPDHEEGEIVDVYEHGYERDGSVIREAKVTVAEGSEGESGSDGGQN